MLECLWPATLDYVQWWLCAKIVETTVRGVKQKVPVPDVRCLSELIAHERVVRDASSFLGEDDASQSSFAGEVEELIQKNGESQDDVRPDKKVENHQVDVPLENHQRIKAQDGDGIQYEVANGPLDDHLRMLEMSEVLAKRMLPRLSPDPVRMSPDLIRSALVTTVRAGRRGGGALPRAFSRRPRCTKSPRGRPL